MYERFTDRARKVMALANQEAHRFGHEYIGTEHILLGLVMEGGGVGANALKNLNVDLPAIRCEVDKLAKPGKDTGIVSKLPAAPQAKKLIERAIAEARGLAHNYVGTEHLLLGMLGEKSDVAALVLTNLGLNLDRVRREVLSLLGQGDDLKTSPTTSAELIEHAIESLRLAQERAAAEGKAALVSGIADQVERMKALLAG